MPELPEVETTLRAIQSFDQDTLDSVTIHNPSLRWLVDPEIHQKLAGKKVTQIFRRAKYIIFDFADYQLIIHLGMSGTLRIMGKNENYFKKHDHAELVFNKNKLIYNDPRRFGSILWTTDNPLEHRLLKNLGPEPLEDGFHAEYLRTRLRAKSQCIKSAIMDGHNVVGVGNIYASEALFYAGIKPQRKSSKLTKKELKALVTSIKDVINKAIVKGGSTMNDFFDVNGENGYFQNEHKVYGRKGKDCYQCDSLVLQITIGQRSSFFCNQCQK